MDPNDKYRAPEYKNYYPYHQNTERYSHVNNNVACTCRNHNMPLGYFYNSYDLIPSNLIDKNIAPKVVYMSNNGTLLFTPVEQVIDQDISRTSTMKVKTSSRSDFSLVLILIFLFLIITFIGGYILYEIFNKYF